MFLVIKIPGINAGWEGPQQPCLMLYTGQPGHFVMMENLK